MTNSMGQLGNVMTRLKGLKNVSGRRVMPEEAVLKNLDPVESDVSGTAAPLLKFENLITRPQNLPQEDMGGELTPQSYDVRANAVENPQQEEGGFFTKLGQALADYVNPEKRSEMMAQREQAMIPKPPIETAQVEAREGILPIEQEVPSEPSRGVLAPILDYFSPTKRAEMEQVNKDLVQNAQIRAQGGNPEIVRQEKQAGLNQEINNAMENPWQHAAFGAAQEVSNHPALRAQFKEVTGMDFEPQIAAMTSQYETAMKGVEDTLKGINTELDAQSEGIKQRILSNQASDADKYYIGLALLMPLLVGGLFGKEAGLGALAGGAKSFADILGQRQKDIRGDEEALLDLAKQRTLNQEKLANIGLEGAKLGPSLRKLAPESPNKHLIGMQSATWTDPATGEQQTGYRIKPGLVAKSEYVNSEEGRKDMLKSANELSLVKTYVDDINNLTDDVVEIAQQLEDPNIFNKIFISILSDQNPGAIPKITQDIMFNGRKVNAGQILEEKFGFLANKYGEAQKLGQLDRAAQSHIQKIISNPATTLSTPQNAIDQMIELRDLAQRGLITEASNRGFVPEFLVSDMENKNKEFIGGLNQKEQEKRTSEVKKKLLKNG